MHRIEPMAAVCDQTYLKLSDAGDLSLGEDKFSRGVIYKCTCIYAAGAMVILGVLPGVSVSVVTVWYHGLDDA